MIKLVVSDMDGTLLNKEAGISKRNLCAIQKIQEMGIEFAIASGRDYFGVYRIINQYNIKCSAILGNGAQYVDSAGNVVMDSYLDKSIYKDIIQVLEDMNIYYMVFTTNGTYTAYPVIEVREAFITRCCHKFGNHRDDYKEDGAHFHAPCNSLKYISDQDEFLKQDFEIIKVEAFCEDVSKIAETKKKLKFLPLISFLSSFDDNVEITDQDAQKGLILEKVIQLKGIKKEEVIVLGDGMNDITLFEHFPYSFAPMNAEDEIKNMAYCIVSDCHEDGFAEAIDIMFKDLGN